MCCWDDQQCAPNGLCVENGAYYREYCTDPTWESPACNKLCFGMLFHQVVCEELTDRNTGMEAFTLGLILTICDDGSFCCGYNNKNCCLKKQGTFIDAKGNIIDPDATTTSKTTSTTTTSRRTTTSATTSATPSSQADKDEDEDEDDDPAAVPTPKSSSASSNNNNEVAANDESPGLSNGAKAGIAIGAVVGFFAIAALAFLFIRQRKQYQGAPVSLAPPPMGDAPPYGPPPEMAYQQHYHAPPISEVSDQTPAVKYDSPPQEYYNVPPTTGYSNAQYAQPQHQQQQPAEKYGYPSADTRMVSELDSMNMRR